MNKNIIESGIFTKSDYTKTGLPADEYEKSTFVNCVFSNADVSNIVFSECEFRGCDLSMARVIKTALKDVTFRECKLVGIQFAQCNPFLLSVDFENCILNLSSFYKLSLKKTQFRKCSLQEVDFTECDLQSSLFDDCDLSRAKFERSVLEKKDFRTSYNYSIDPEKNRLKKARFSAAGIVGLLDKYDITVE
jgi:fluoroquinolone resistance protein